MTVEQLMTPGQPEPTGWQGGELAATDGLVMLSSNAAEEILHLAETLAANPLPVLALDPNDFDLPACRAVTAEARVALTEGPGFAIIDRLPLTELSRDGAVAAYWLMMTALGRPVAQKWDGRMVYDVADLTGKKPGHGIRPDVTNAEQNFHTDNSYNVCPPDIVTLLCLQTAKAGGVSSVVSMTRAHDQMRKSHPALLQRLYQPFYFDRQTEHAPGDTPYIKRPVFALENGRLRTRISRYLIEQGYRLAGETLDELGDEAIDRLTGLIDDPAARKDFYFEPGQIQIVDNRRLCHKRSGFEDWPEPARRRHLVRLWLRDKGRPFYNG